MAMDLDAFRLDLRQLCDVALALEARVREGLAADDREVKALPAFLRPPTSRVSGEALVVDAGGTNVRAARVRLGGEGDAILSGPKEARLPVRGDPETLSAEGFWKLQAGLVGDCDPVAGLPLGYCFSYPSRVHDDRDATLITWTKGVDIPGVEGQRVGAPLAQALAGRGLEPRRTVVLNDTVAALLGGSATAADPERVIGLICGTGTNMAAFFRPNVAPKLAAFGPDPMAVNLESGNFHPPHLTAIDEDFDASGDKRGQQRFEKAVAGYALPFLFERLVPNVPGFDPHRGTAQLVDIRASGLGPTRDAADVLLDRSADLIAAGLWGVARVVGGTTPLTVLAEGSLLWKTPGYRERVLATLQRLDSNGPAFQIEHRLDVNLFGSAAAALSVSD